MRTRVLAACAALVASSSIGWTSAHGETRQGPTLVDGFEDPVRWSARPAEGVELKVGSGQGLHGPAMRLDFRFVKGGGYAVVHREVSLDLTENYRFRFAIRGECPTNNLEFKLIDASGENVWWSNQRDFRFPARWDSVTLKKRHIGFAWGPQGGGEIRHVAAIEFAVTAGSGGAGTVWIDDLTLEALPPAGVEPPPPLARASSARVGHDPGFAVDGDSATSWASAVRDRFPWIELDLGGEREFGGLVVEWVSGQHGRDYVIEASDDGATWRTLRLVRSGNGGRDYLYLPESEARRVRLRVLRGASAGIVGVRSIEVEPLEWASSQESFFRAIAHNARRGLFPRGIRGEQSYWTVVGEDGDRREGLLNEDGMLETGKASFSIEPFLYVDRRLVTWSDVRTEAWLEGGHLPIPSVRWRGDSLELSITAFASGEPGASSLYARYRVRNAGVERRHATLYLALRPFQVNPPSQFLNTPGGVAPLRSLTARGRVVLANAERGVVSLTAPAGFGAATFDEGDITDYLGAGRLPPRRELSDGFERASGALAYTLDLTSGAEQEVDLLVPLHDPPQVPPAVVNDAAARQLVEAQLAACRRTWQQRTGRVTIDLPEGADDVKQTLEAQLGWILVNRDSAAIQPGSRSYERSWIRDGSLTSSALLRLGQPEVVRDFIEWFVPYQYADGKVPCCVDWRGSDPVPEHDSGGEFIFLVAEYHRYTGDRERVERWWPAVARAAAYLDSLRQQRRTSEYREPQRRVFFGLLPPSISHEGYSAKPMHSYWDDLFALRGFKDAVYLAGVLGRPDDQARLAAIRDQFQEELVASIEASMALHKIDYLPGCADLGDFDATSTTIALDPVQAQEALPRGALERTFEKYWQFFSDRRDGRSAWEAFTPYEMRAIGAMVRLGWRDRANQALDWFMKYRRPQGWAQWGEVVWHDERTAHFIGDMPHTWVGSDFARSVLDMLAYEREADSALVVGAGVPWGWVSGVGGVSVTRLRTPHGELGFNMRARGEAVEVHLEGALRVPRGGVVVRAPFVKAFQRASVNGVRVTLSGAGEVVVRELPSTVTLEP